MSSGPMELLRRFGSLFRRRDLDNDLDSELANHVDLAAADYRKKGMSEEEARRMALLRLGGVEQSKEVHRDARGLPRLEAVLQDARYAFRTLRRDAGFAVFVTLIIGLGIGACATVFSVVNSMLIRPLPFQDPSQIVWLANGTDATADMSARTFQVIPTLELRDRNHSFTDIAGYFAFYGIGDIPFADARQAERLTGVGVTEKFFSVLGVSPHIGRLFTASECERYGPSVVLLSDAFWERRFARDPRIIGSTIRLGGKPSTVIGVMPASFDFGSVFAPGTRVDLFFPFPLTRDTDRWGNTLALVGRLKPGAQLASAQAEADILGSQISDEDKRRNSLHPSFSLLSEHVSGQIRPALLILAGAVLVVMLIVCANVSNLMLARTAARQKEMAIRAALGAGRGRLARQLFTESLILTGCGALLGVGLAYGATISIAHLTAFNLPLLNEVRMDARALGFVALIAVITGLLLGLAPALRISLPRLNASLGRSGAGGSREHAWLRGGLVTAEIAFACVLLVGAGLLVRSFVKVLDTRLGFRPQSAATIRIDPDLSYDTEGRKMAYLNDALRRVRSIPGVQSAGVTDALPLGKNRAWGAGAKGATYKENEYPDAFVRIISDGYFAAMGIPVTRGRDFDERDAAQGNKVIVINESMAHAFWPGENPLGKIIVGDCAKEREVIGVVADVRHMALEKESGNEMYIPMRQCDDRTSWDLVVRANLPIPALGRAVDDALRPIAPDLPKGGMRPLTQLVDRAVSPRRFIVSLLSGFAVFALILASLGIYGLISYSVNRSAPEIGVRMALGASAFEVQRRIVARTLALAATGMIAGVLISWIAGRSVGSLLYGVAAADPSTFAAAAFVLLAVSAIAGYLPARRASRIDPMICLRAE
ncbi:MAG TPA: ABC transporter permease [Bryobacteraceae bacterium]|nr:ABC transporter permease [Bryobacteraceae bacterium]